MSDSVKLVIEAEFSRRELDKFNASLYGGPEHDDPIQGDGAGLLRDIVFDDCVGELLDEHSSLSECLTSITVRVDGEKVPMPDRFKKVTA